jgi:hypothetical protein
VFELTGILYSRELKLLSFYVRFDVNMNCVQNVFASAYDTHNITEPVRLL